MVRGQGPREDELNLLHLAVAFTKMLQRPLRDTLLSVCVVCALCKGTAGTSVCMLLIKMLNVHAGLGYLHIFH